MPDKPHEYAMMPVRSVKIYEVIVVEDILTGQGTPESPMRRVCSVFTKGGKFVVTLPDSHFPNDEEPRF